MHLQYYTKFIHIFCIFPHICCLEEMLSIKNSINIHINNIKDIHCQTEGPCTLSAWTLISHYNFGGSVVDIDQIQSKLNPQEKFKKQYNPWKWQKWNQTFLFKSNFLWGLGHGGFVCFLLCVYQISNTAPVYVHSLYFQESMHPCKGCK